MIKKYEYIIFEYRQYRTKPLKDIRRRIRVYRDTERIFIYKTYKKEIDKLKKKSRQKVCIE